MSTYLITGANRGIGKALLQHYLSKENTTVVAAVRNPSSASALEKLPAGKGSKVIVVKISSTSETDAKEAAEELATKHGVTKLDVVIANAGILTVFGPLLTSPPNAVREHWEVNCLGPLILFQGLWPLMEKAVSPKFVVISTFLGTIGGMESIGTTPFGAYGSSKAAVNYVLRKLHFEHPSLISVAVNPGWVQTDMGNGGANAAGMEQAPLTLEDSIAGVTKMIDGATKENGSGKFLSHDGTELTW